MRNLVLTCSYDGSAYFGWQMTALGPSVEGTLKQVLEQILQHEVVLQAASRTDRGVHALHQVVNLFTSKSIDTSALQKSLNALLPPTLVILKIHEAPLTFHPTLDAEGKQYRYLIDTSPIPSPFKRLTHWHLPLPGQWHIAQEASHDLLGEHDFAAFCNRREGKGYDHTVRQLWRCDIQHLDHEIHIFIAGNHFLYKMVRNLVGTLAGIALGKTTTPLTAILASRRRAQAGVCAPAHGLFLDKIFYSSAFYL